jgi:predicted AAA+ superfamily ATPase
VSDFAVKLLTMYTRLLPTPRRTFFLFGPRGTGKTTWLRQRFQGALWFDLLDQSLYLDLLRDPGRFRAEVLAHGTATWVVVDEVQKLPALLDEVHRLTSERGSDYKFALSGSSARKLRRGGANLLAGRAINREFFPLVAKEINYDLNLDEVLRFGMLPKVRSEVDAAVGILEAYAVNYIREEVQQEALVQDIGSFARFLEVAALMNGQVLNVANVARDSAVTRPTVQRYFDVLVDTLIGYRLPAWRAKPRVKMVASPKFYLFDTGVVRALGNRVRVPLSDEERGVLLETYVLHELRAWINQADCGGELFYYRTRGGVEVDFIWRLGDNAVGIEVKSTQRWRPQDARGLRDLLENKVIQRAFGVYRGDRELLEGEVRVLPLIQFVKALQSGQVIG